MEKNRQNRGVWHKMLVWSTTVLALLREKNLSIRRLRRMQTGTLYRSKNWVMRVRLVGQPPIGGKRYELENLRCGTCGKTHVAEPPEEMGSDKYDVSVASTIATLRYGQGMPSTRLERLQASAGIPLPASRQWELCRDALDLGLRHVFEHLWWEAAQGDLVLNDDTPMRVLECSIKAKKGEPLREDVPQRTGVFTTGILSKSARRPTIALFFTGVAHADDRGPLFEPRQTAADQPAGAPPPARRQYATSSQPFP